MISVGDLQFGTHTVDKELVLAFLLRYRVRTTHAHGPRRGTPPVPGGIRSRTVTCCAGACMPRLKIKRDHLLPVRPYHVSEAALWCSTVPSRPHLPGQSQSFVPMASIAAGHGSTSTPASTTKDAHADVLPVDEVLG